MNLRTFVGPALPDVLAQVRLALGDQAMIVHTTQRVVDGRRLVEVVAASALELEPLCDRLTRQRPAPAAPAHRSGRPRVVALVGPTGSGKTTMAAKLAFNPRAFGDAAAGFLALDTYRVGALEQLQTYADILAAPLEPIYYAGDIDPALRALAGCDVVLVDAPGRSPATAGFLQWRTALAAAEPDEVHLVLPATIRADVAAAHRAAYEPCGLTHLMVTKLDELVNVGDIGQLMDAVDLPVSWASDGQDVPDHLLPGGVTLFDAAARAVGAARLRVAG
jgi:flagellar biosynthesis protein FlhF